MPSKQEPLQKLQNEGYFAVSRALAAAVMTWVSLPSTSAAAIACGSRRKPLLELFAITKFEYRKSGKRHLTKSSQLGANCFAG